MNNSKSNSYQIFGFSAVSSTRKQITTTVDQTLTCTIEALDASGTPVTVAWTDPDDAVISDSDTENYVLSQGTVDNSGVQNAELTIKAAKLASFAEQDSFTYKCSVAYTGSETSAQIDVVANVLTFGKFGKDNCDIIPTISSLSFPVFVILFFPFNQSFIKFLQLSRCQITKNRRTIDSSGVTAVNQEQLEGTEAKVSCIVNGLTKALDKVTWTRSDNSEIESGMNSFVIDAGTLDSNSQTTILTVPAAANTQDTTFNCLISSREHGKTDDNTSVSLKVFSK